MFGYWSKMPEKMFHTEEKFKYESSKGSFFTYFSHIKIIGTKKCLKERTNTSKKGEQHYLKSKYSKTQ